LRYLIFALIRYLLDHANAQIIDMSAHYAASPASSSDTNESASGAASPSSFIFRAALVANRAEKPAINIVTPQTCAAPHTSPIVQTPRNMGPLSAEVRIPPRPKPGRKPMTTEGEGGEKRKAQNRNAQRRFRDKRQQKLEDQVEVNDNLRKEIQDCTANYERRLGAVRMQHQAELQLLQQRIDQQQEEITSLKAALDKANEERRSYSSTSFASRGIESISLHQHTHAQAIEAVSTPPHENEIDFTNYGRSMGTDDKCGFCGTGDTCPCSQSAAAAAAAAASKRQTGPGTCDQCRSDPTGERARACMAMAANSTVSAGESQLPPNRTGRRTVPCGTVVDAFRDAHAEPSSISTLFGGQKMQAYAADRGGFDFEHNEAAKVLVQLNERIVKRDGLRHDSF
jgi:hypothetical protein